MKKIVIVIISLLIAGLIVFALVNHFNAKPDDNKNETEKTETNIIENHVDEEVVTEGYDILVSKNNITINKGSEASFEITFTNPDLSSIREYIKCEDQSDIVLVKYSNLIDGVITVDVEGLRAGETEILVCDYNYPDLKEIVKVTVVDE